MQTGGRSGRQPRQAPVPPVIECEADIKAGIAALRRRCPILRHMHDVAGDPPLRRRAGGFEGLARIIVGQQVSVASAEAIWLRTFAAVQPFTHGTLLAASDEALRGAGLSRPKIVTLRAIATSIETGALDLAGLTRLDDAAVAAALTAVKGIGPWTADVYILFCLGRTDAFAAGDLALQVAAEWAFELDARPDPKALVALAERWRPWRGVAARMLWAYYKARKDGRSGMPL